MSQNPGGYLDCLKFAVGLSRTNCGCFDNPDYGNGSDKPSDFDKSESNLFLDEIPGLTLDMVSAATDCKDGGLWDLMQQAREEGIKQFVQLFLTNLLTTNAYKIKPISPVCIGGNDFTKQLTYAGTFGGVRAKTNNQRGGIWKINRFGVLLQNSTNFTLSVYNNISATALAVYQLTGVAGQLTENTLPATLELPLGNDLCKQLEYYFIFSSTSASVKNTLLDCGCSSKKAQDYENFVKMSGISGNVIADRAKWATTNYAYGLVICGDLTCKTEQVICSPTNSLDYNSDPMAMQFATGLRYKQAEVLVEKILATGNLNRYTMMLREELYGKRNHYRKMAETMLFGDGNNLQGLIDNWSLTRNDCLKCFDNRIGKTNILV